MVVEAIEAEVREADAREAGASKKNYLIKKRGLRR